MGRLSRRYREWNKGTKAAHQHSLMAERANSQDLMFRYCLEILNCGVNWADVQEKRHKPDGESPTSGYEPSAETDRLPRNTTQPSLAQPLFSKFQHSGLQMRATTPMRTSILPCGIKYHFSLATIRHVGL